METSTQHKLIEAIEKAFFAANLQPNPKETFVHLLGESLDKLHRKGLIDDEEHRDAINARETVYNTCIQQVNDPTPNTIHKGLRGSVKMLGPQFVIDREIRDRVVGELGAFPVWAVVSTFAADTMYAGLTYPEAIHRAQIESLEPGRQANVVLQLQRFEGPSLLTRK